MGCYSYCFKEFHVDPLLHMGVNVGYEQGEFSAPQIVNDGPEAEEQPRRRG